MNIQCPKCKTTFKVRDEILPKNGGKLRCFKCKEIFFFEAKKEENGHLVLIAIEDVSSCEAASDILRKHGFKVEVSHNGVDALIKVQGKKPALAILDIALPRMYGFDVCEAIRDIEAVKDTKIILIAEIYDQGRYRRAPQSLYGADDYIEKQNLNRDILSKVSALLNVEVKIEEEAVPPVVVQPVTEKIREETISDSAAEIPGDVEGKKHEKARRLARTIVSDIALYNEQLVTEGIKGDNFFELLKDDIAEGKKLFSQRVSEDIRESRDYLMEYLEEFVEKHKRHSADQ